MLREIRDETQVRQMKQTTIHERKEIKKMENNQEKKTRRKIEEKKENCRNIKEKTQ